jgi:hypothetical protein
MQPDAGSSTERYWNQPIPHAGVKLPWKPSGRR